MEIALTNTTVTGADVTSGLSVLAESARLQKDVSTKKNDFGTSRNAEYCST